MNSFTQQLSAILHMSQLKNVLWKHQGRIWIGRCDLGILRFGTLDDIKSEHQAHQHLPKDLYRFAPQILHYWEVSGAALLVESHLGEAMASPQRILQGWLQARTWQKQAPQERTIHQWLKLLQPHGKIKVQSLKKALSKHQIKVSTTDLEKALRHKVSVSLHRGLVHGSLLPRRIRSDGFCSWRNLRLGFRGQDIAPYLQSIEQPLDIQLHRLKWAWNNDPKLAYHILVHLQLLNKPAQKVELRFSAHPGIATETLSLMLGCQDGLQPRHLAVRAVGRAQKLQLAGQAVKVHCTPTITGKADNRFFIPRQRVPQRLFSRWSEGIQLDEQGRYSVTPEADALAIAKKLHAPVIIDAFCGGGGNAIAFARMPWSQKVIACDTNKQRLQHAKHNAMIYCVEQKITFLHGDSLQIAPKNGAIFVDPPWEKGKSYLTQVWQWAKNNYAQGAIKLPRDFPVPVDESIDLHLNPQHFPSFLVVYWKK